MKHKLLKYDPSLRPFEKDIDLRVERYAKKKKELLAPGQTLLDFANGHEYFGFHRENGGTVRRISQRVEVAQNAVGGNAQLLGVEQTAVSGNNEIIGFQGRGQSVKIRGAENNAGAHGIPSFLF